MQDLTPGLAHVDDLDRRQRAAVDTLAQDDTAHRLERLRARRRAARHDDRAAPQRDRRAS